MSEELIFPESVVLNHNLKLQRDTTAKRFVDFVENALDKTAEKLRADMQAQADVEIDKLKNQTREYWWDEGQLRSKMREITEILDSPPADALDQIRVIVDRPTVPLPGSETVDEDSTAPSSAI